MIQAERLRVVDEEMNDVPADGATMGEIVMRGNNVMKGYFDDEEATAEAFRGGWFHSGDLGVMHPDGYVELRDRAKDIVISGGENISTVEIEQALLTHAAVLEAAVIGVPDEKWGERPKAFVVLKPGKEASRRSSSTTSSPTLPATRRRKLSPSSTSCQRPRRARSRSSSSGSASGPGKTPESRGEGHRRVDPAAVRRRQLDWERAESPPRRHGDGELRRTATRRGRPAKRGPNASRGRSERGSAMRPRLGQQPDLAQDRDRVGVDVLALDQAVLERDHVQALPLDPPLPVGSATRSPRRIVLRVGRAAVHSCTTRSSRT